ncbi:MAG: carboxypeptidase-like regulatory domain-containing protein, partial [Actinomycetota bacterium]
VFTGAVTNISIVPLDLGEGRTGYKQRMVRFSLEESFRGVQGRTVEILTGMGGGDCGYDFKQGEKYFVYAYLNPKDEKLHVGICGRTLPLTSAASDIEYARAVMKGRTDSIIFGIVLRYTRDTYVDYGRHKGLEGVKVFVEGNGKRFNLATNAEGRFQLEGLAAGTYKVRAEIPGNLRKTPEQEVVVTEGRCAGAAFLTTSLAAIKGKLVDAEGRPVSNIDLKILPADIGSTKELWHGREISSQTDEGGYYIFDQVPPGQYVIAINYEGQPSLFGPPFPRSYYPGTGDLDKAKTIIVAEGQEIQAGDFHLPPRLVERSIEGAVVWPDGKPAVGTMVALEFTERSWIEQHTPVDDQGRFSLKCFEGYRYLVSANYHDAAKSAHAAPREVLVIPENQPLTLVLTNPGRSPFPNPNKRKAS